MEILGPVGDGLLGSLRVGPLQKSLLRFHRKNRGPVDWALTQAVYAAVMPIRAVAFAVLALVGRREDRRVKLRQAVTATRYHLLRIEPQL